LGGGDCKDRGWKPAQQKVHETSHQAKKKKSWP
jgi:hypothetical protein